MSVPFMRVDVSQTSRDFKPVALEPGLPLLDRSNSNGQVLRKWLGTLVAEPERVGDLVAFYVRDDESRRLDGAVCLPITDKDLNGPLKKEFKELLRRFDSVKTQSSNEQLIHKVVTEQIKELSDENNVRERCSSLFRYVDGTNKLHLVWAPGFRRRDNEPATPLVCSNANCARLFLQRANMSVKCPVCNAVRRQPVVEKRPRNFTKTLTRLLGIFCLVAVGILGTWWWKQKDQSNPTPKENLLIVAPSTWSGPIGSQVQFVITRNDGDQPVEVTSSAAVTVFNPKILSVKPYENVGKALSPGQTHLTFFVDDLTVQASVIVEPRTMPKSLALQPAKLELGIGTTGQLKLIGEFEGGNTADLTDDAQWEPNQDGTFFVHKGRVEGEAEGIGKVRVHYRVDDSTEPLEQTADIVVRDLQYSKLDVTVDPNPVQLGKPARVQTVVASKDGTEFQVDESKDLTIDIAPPERATVQGSELESLSEGPLKITAQFRGLTSVIESQVVKPDTAPQSLEVSPKTLALKVGELVRLNVVSGRPHELKFQSSQPEVVEATASGQIIGRGIGTAEIEVADGAEPTRIPCTVSVADWSAIAMEPARVSVRADETADIHVFGIDDKSDRAELAPDQVTWIERPHPDFAEFDAAKSQIKGIKPTGDAKQRLTAKVKAFEASVEVEIVAAPTILTLSPEGSIEVPLGQKRGLKVTARSGGTQPLEAPPERVEWAMSSDEGFEIRNGEIYATSDHGETLLSAKYQGATSNEVRVSSAPATPLTLKATAVPTSLPQGSAGIVKVTATGLGGEVQINQDSLSFVSSDPAVVQVDAQSGAFRAIAAGQATISVSHSSAKNPADATVTVTAAAAPPALEKPASLRLISNQGNPIKLPIAAEFSDWKVEAVSANGSMTDVSGQSTLVVEGDAEQAVATVRNRRIVAVNPGTATVRAVYRGIRTVDGLQVEVINELDIDEIRLTPGAMNLLIGESALFKAVGFKSGKSVGDITNRSDLVWKSADEVIATTIGPQVNARKKGSTTITALFGRAVSKGAKVACVEPDSWGRTPSEVGKLIVIPSSLRLKVGQVVALGQEVIIQRQSTDLSSACDVAPPSNQSVAYDAASRTLKAVAPGRSQVTFIVRDQSATLNVDVDPEALIPADSNIVIEPSGGQLVVGEDQPLRVFVVTPDGTRASASALFKSLAPKVATISGSSIRGVAPGKVAVEARVSGIDQPGKAMFSVEELQFERLAFNPESLTIPLGEGRPFEVYGVTSQRRVKLGNSPRLKVAIDHDGSHEQFSSDDFEVQGINLGNESVVATWNGKLTQRMPFAVVPADSGSELVIQPETASIEEGASVDYQVFARRSGKLQPLSETNDLKLTIVNSAVASIKKLRANAIHVGQTEVVASYGTQRATAQLKVGRRSRPEVPTAQPERLRFVNDTVQMTLDDPDCPVQVVQVLADGTETPVDQFTLSVQDPQDVVEVTKTSSGQVIRPKKEGMTQIHATSGKLRTQKPLLVDVSQGGQNRLKLRVSPDTLRIRVGETAEFDRAEIIPASGQGAAEVPYKITTAPNKIVEIVDGKAIKGLEVGRTVVTITADDGKSSHTGLKASAAVEVVSLASESVAFNNWESGKRPGGHSGYQPPPDAQLVLTGPSETNVGAEVRMRVEAVVGRRSTDVTNRAQLVQADRDESIAEIRSAGIIKAKAAGQIRVQARLGELTSRPQEIKIRPMATFERIELETDKTRIAVNEVLPYKLWGYPRGGGARQDLTLLAPDDQANSSPQIQLKTVQPESNAIVAEQQPGAIIGKQNGQVIAQARLDKLVSKPVNIDVAGSVTKPKRIKLEPNQLEILEGSTTPPVRVLIASAGSNDFREIDPALVRLTASDSTVLAPQSRGLFQGTKPGKADIKAVYEGLEQTIPVTVRFNPFLKIEVSSNPDIKTSTLIVDLIVSARLKADGFEYRTSLPNARSAEETSWVKAEKQKDQLIAKLRSPKIPIVSGQNSYSIVIEAKDLATGKIERNPFSFKISTSGMTKPVTDN